MRSILLAILIVTLTWVARACPTCMALPPSLNEDLDNAKAVVVASKVAGKGNRFRIERVLRGQLQPGKIVTTATVDAKLEGSRVLLTTLSGPGAPFWTGKPRAVEGDLLKFVEGAVALPHRFSPKSRPQRLKFYLNYLGHSQRTFSDAAYSEFAQASYKSVVGLAPQIGRNRLRSWITSPTTPDEHRSLYYVMLGGLRDKADLDLLEPLLKKELAKRNPVALSALLVAYLNIKGPEGLTMLEKDVMSANLERRANGLEALRVHASETSPIPLQQILPIMRKQLKQPDLAGPVIQDLAFLRDWKVLPDIVALTQQPKSKVDAWVRISAVRYLRTCPLPEARQQLTRLKSRDPELVDSAPFPFVKPPAQE